MAGHTVTGPLVVATAEDGKVLYLYEGSPIPDSVPAGEVARLVGTGLVAEVGAPARSARKPADEK